MKAFFQAYWPHLVGVLLIVSLSWGQLAYRRYQRHKLVQAEAEAAAAIAVRETAARQRYAAYQLDSTRRATQRQALQKMDSSLAHQDHAISTAYPTPIYLPASPPRERPAAPASRSPR